MRVRRHQNRYREGLADEAHAEPRFAAHLGGAKSFLRQLAAGLLPHLGKHGLDLGERQFSGCNDPRAS